ncbi:DUF2247 family protein [Nocardia vulneris]|uniref:DUF2247 domain-containing protein n=1 Tax=Nocardia vulneris TaxID=1141657 RepID=A0ABR4Z8H6_9NOCA|nr:DUF2247 family protein [Nocardia vulneris]KIA61653.1 hypothetical protein FG87_29970 [Nocardia vulneris]
MNDDDNDSVKFNIPASFIAERAELTPSELRYGYEHQWITSKDVVALALTSIVPADDKMAVIEDISLLLSDELDRIPDLMEKLFDHDEKVWLYLALAWVHENRSEFEEPFKTVDLLYADFGYPDDVGDFVTFMPPPPGGVPGVPGLTQRWQKYLDDNRAHFLQRAAEQG